MQDANAELIVTAVNSHQELITRLYNLVNELDNAEQIPDFCNPKGVQLRRDEARETLKKFVK